MKNLKSKMLYSACVALAAFSFAASSAEQICWSSTVCVAGSCHIISNCEMK